ncbi:hypothetical protein C0J52_17768 [Blattella germanica]|nr:hypothetical protein C0J52_17768 [Blattella germanica]
MQNAICRCLRITFSPWYLHGITSMTSFLCKKAHLPILQMSFVPGWMRSFQDASWGDASSPDLTPYDFF